MSLFNLVRVYFVFVLNVFRFCLFIFLFKPGHIAYSFTDPAFQKIKTKPIINILIAIKFQSLILIHCILFRGRYWPWVSEMIKPFCVVIKSPPLHEYRLVVVVVFVNTLSIC